MNVTLNRRDALKAGALALVAAQIEAGAANAQTAGGRLVVFLSRSGNTRVLAGALARRYNAPTFELRPRTPWPEDYEEMVAWASELRERGAAVPLAQEPGDLGSTRTIFLGFPIWGMAVPAIVTSFLRANDLSGKTIAPLITHGGYGAGNAMETHWALAPNATFLDPFVLECDQERNTLQALGGWADQVGRDL